MFEDSDPIVEAVTVITSRGHTVEPDTDFERCRINGGEWLTVGELLTLAMNFGLNAGVGRLQ